MNLPFKTLDQLFQYFNHEDKARDFLEKMRWPDGRIICPICGVRGAYRNADMKTYSCRDMDCRAKFSVTVGTMMENTKLPLCKWFAAIWLITGRKKGISSCQLARDLGIGQKAAWFLNHRIREMVKEQAPDKLENIVEIDETHVGGKFANMTKTKRKKWLDSGTTNKIPVMGLIQRDGKAKMAVIGSSTLKEVVRQHVAKNAIVMTDAHLGYIGLDKEFAAHHSINHDNLEFKSGIITTNSVEGFFSHFKRMVIGTYHQLSPFHLQRYCDEAVYRYNTRKITDRDRFINAMSKTQGRLKWKDLIAPKEINYDGIEFVNGDN